MRVLRSKHAPRGGRRSLFGSFLGVAVSGSAGTKNGDDLYRARIASLLDQIEEKARAERERKGREPLGRAAILSQDPHGKPVRSKKSPAPRFHTFRKTARQDLYDAYSWFVAAFRTASEKLRSGDLTASFPPGSFPPALPFVS